MKIALISVEYPPDTGWGGIGTYVFQASRMLAARGHHVEVIAGTEQAEDSTRSEEGVLVHRVTLHRGDFQTTAGQVFATRHAHTRFDVLEGPEYRADAHLAANLCPDVPLLVKLHTPFYMIAAMTRVEGGALGRSRIVLGRMRRHMQALLPFLPVSDPEHKHALEADAIVSPCQSLAEITTRDWKLDKERVEVVPYPYTPSEAMLSIPAETDTNRVTFLGRLEVRKGVLDLGRAIPAILKQCPQARFRFVGMSQKSPRAGMNMEEYLRFTLREHESKLEFVGRVPLEQIPQHLRETDICVFPSLWENFPNVCLEAMAAARGVIGSQAGGMAEMLDGGSVGPLVAPRCPEQIAAAVIDLLQNPAKRVALGKAARQRILDVYNLNRIAAMQEASYEHAIRNHQRRPRRRGA